MGRVPTINKRRLVFAFMVFCAALVALCARDGYIQIVKGEEYTRMAMEQQTMDQMVEAKRGDIVDRNGNKMAVSTIKYSVWIRPASVMNSDKETKELRDQENAEKIDTMVNGLAEILGIDPEKIRAELDTDKTLIKIAKYQERDTADAIRAWTLEENVSGVSISEETKRYYPMESMAAQVLGSVTDDNNGLSGLELYYNSYLKGVPGRWIQNKDASGRSLSYGESKYYEAEDGATLVLTIDVAVQTYAEEACKAAYKERKAEQTSCIVMDTRTGEILAMASYPNFDPNNPRVPGNSKDVDKFNAMSEEDQLDYLNQMWRNPLVNDTYVPGSTMKLVTTSAALEEDLTNPQEPFYDSGSIDVYGTELKCWRWREPHGDETLTQAVRNSCNPVFVQLAQRIGTENFYAYLALFGLTQPTGIDYPGEATSQVQDIKTAGPVGLATMAYGQGIAVTPIQQITAINAIANDGKLVQPHLVKEIRSADGEVIKSFDPVIVRQTISQSTATQVRNIMQFVVEDGGAGEARVKGWDVGGKTGTSNIEAESNKIIASFVGVAPIEDPEITVLFIVRDPQGEIYGSTVAAPYGMEVIENTMKYRTVESIGEKSKQ
ncbi:MAG: stage V sporulation protein D [Clostridiales bacterium]|nr:stage V sporulation protein D [Clostridiales bacterium]